MCVIGVPIVLRNLNVTWCVLMYDLEVDRKFEDPKNILMVMKDTLEPGGKVVTDGFVIKVWVEFLKMHFSDQIIKVVAKLFRALELCLSSGMCDKVFVVKLQCVVNEVGMFSHLGKVVNDAVSHQERDSGPVRLLQDEMDKLKVVEEKYKSWFKIWRASFIPKLVVNFNWFNGSMFKQMVFLQTAELDVDLGSLRIRTMVIVVDMQSRHDWGELQYVYWDLAIDWGAETYARVSIVNVSIQLRVALYRESGLNIPRCSIKRKEHPEAAFGDVHENQLTVAPTCWFCQMEQLGSVDVYLYKLKFKDQVERDVVYFVKKYGALCDKWTIEMVEAIDRGKNGVIRKATIKNCNFSDEKLSIDQEQTSVDDDMTELVMRMKVIDYIDKQISDVYDTPAANTRLKTKGKGCYCVVHCEFKLHLPRRFLQEMMPLAMETEMMSICTILSMEEEEVPSGEIYDLTGLFSSVNLDISMVFRQ